MSDKNNESINEDIKEKLSDTDGENNSQNNKYNDLTEEDKIPEKTDIATSKEVGKERAIVPEYLQNDNDKNEAKRSVGSKGFGKNKKSFSDNEDNVIVKKLGDLAGAKSDGENENDMKKSLISKESKKSFTERWFSKINPDSMRGNIFNLSIIALGTGPLAFPIHFGNMSVLTGALMTIICGVCALWSLNLLVIAGVKHNIYDYTHIVKHVYGKGMSVFLDIVIIFYITGQIILYQVIIYQLIGGVVYDFGGYSKQEEYKEFEMWYKNSYWNNNEVKFPLMYGILIITILPLSLITNISKLRFTSIMGVVIFIAITFILVFESPFYIRDYWEFIYNKDDPKTHLNIWNMHKGFSDKHLKFFKGTSTIFYSYCCHFNAYTAMKALGNPTKERMTKVFARSIFIDIVFFLIVGVMGYLSVPYDTPALIVGRNQLFENDYFTTIGRFMFCCVLLFKIPVHFNSLRLALMRVLLNTSKITKKTNYFITVPFMLITCLVSLLYTDIGDYLSILGGYCSVSMSFLIPCLLYVRSNEYTRYHWKNITSIILMSILVAIGYTAGTLTIIDMISGKH